MLDDANVLKQRDPARTLLAVENAPEQLVWEPQIRQPEHDFRTISNVVICGMGGSALAADMIRTLSRDWLNLPFEVAKGYDLPAYVNHSSLVIAVSHSGNTEETFSCYQQARERSSQVAVVAGGGKLLEIANSDSVVHTVVPTSTQPRMSTIYHLRALLRLLNHFNIFEREIYDQVSSLKDWLASEVRQWHPGVPMHENYAKQLALIAVGKTPVIYGGPLTSALAYKWKISWNENAKNIAFSSQYPEFNHNEFIGWSSHPIEKPFVIFDLMSNFEAERIQERMELSDKLLSGRRPKTNQIHLKGDNLLAQQLWGLTLADAVSIYVAILNGVNPEPVVLVEKFKQELS